MNISMHDEPSSNTERALMEAARGARRAAYAPYSEFRVGAAIQTIDGTIFTGCNVENASYGLSICAERVAATLAVASGQRQFSAVAIVAETEVTPCGACRQFLAEFSDDALVLLLCCDDRETDQVTRLRLRELFPLPFRLHDAKDRSARLARQDRDGPRRDLRD